MKRALVVSALALSLAACSGTAFNADVTGTIHGTSFVVEDAVSAAVTRTSGGATATMAEVFISDHAGICSDIQNAREPSSARAIVIDMGDVNGATGSLSLPTAPGTFAVWAGTGVPPSKLATVNVFADDAMCHDDPANDAAGASGTVTITAIAGDKFSGNFDLTLDSGDHITGTFDPDPCASLNSVSSSPTCI